MSILGQTQSRIWSRTLLYTKEKLVGVVRGVPNRVLDSTDECLHQSQGVQRRLLVGLRISVIS